MKILVRLPNWLGDVVMSTAFIGAVKQFYPAAQVDVIIKKELSAIASLIPGLTNIHAFSKDEYRGLGGVYRYGKTLRAENYDIFFTLPDSLSAAVMGKATNAKQRIGYSKEGGFFLFTKTCKRPKNAHRVDEYLSILEQVNNMPVTGRKVMLTPTEVKKNNLVLLNFNSEAESRRMPIDTARNMLNLLTHVFPEYRFGLLGGPKDVLYIEQLVKNPHNPDRIENYAGKTTLVTLSNLIASAKAMLSTDSGPAHLGNALGIPVIALFGAGNERNTAPYNKLNLTVIRAGQLECEPCVRNECRLYGIPKCMQLLDEPRIVNALSQYLNHA
ncbi:glycosyltransferase family 9 protein [Mucilaginibacter ximonensis]|uniref:Glycosyltransferase family 9 protein n=1 Tax=Mucilaginibacter ximonensis TaxID=538021 RepID=A0ABW5YF22_9SPHI